MAELTSSSPTGKAQTVLLVDDDSCTDTGPIHLLIADLLLPQPALQLASRKNPFPRVHGQELVTRVVAVRPQVRVLLMSAHSDEELKSHGINKGSLPFLKKPFNGDSLIKRVRQILASPPVLIEKKDEGPKKGEEKDVEWYD